MTIPKQTKLILAFLFLAVLAVCLYLFLPQVRQALQPLYRADDIQKDLRQVAPQPPRAVPLNAEAKRQLLTALRGITNHTDLINKLNAEFAFQERDGKQVRAPEEFFALKQGNQLDFALFTAFALRQQNLGEVAVLRYRYIINQGKERIGSGVIFRGRDLPPKYISFGPNGAEVMPYGWSFDELFQMKERRIGAKITGYRIFLLWPLPTAEDLWLEEWQGR